MSFILDALKKSEEDRTGDFTPQPGRHVLSPQRPAHSRWGLLLAGVLIIVVSLFLGWWIGSKPTGELAQNIEKTVPQQQPGPMTGPAAIPAAEPAAPPAMPKIKPRRETAPIPSSVRPLPAAPPMVAPVPRKLQPEEPMEVTTAEPEVVTEKPRPATLQPKSIVNFDELPRSVRQELPTLNVSLHFYSPDQARRMIRVNGQILHEHEFVTDKLTVEEIREASTLFNYRGRLFELPAPGTK